jgi:thiol-disulfide isomerase/thioredoxin
MKTVLLTALLLAPLATLQSSEPRQKPGLPAPQLKISEWTEPRLKPGDPAPKLIATEWIQGGPATAFDKDKIYLVEFFATPLWICDDSIPHFNALYQKFKDKGLIVIGQNVNAKLAGGDSTMIKSLVGKRANPRIYPVALDLVKKPQGSMMDTWMSAAGQTCLPCAFLVGKDGRIAWIGNPAELNETKMAYPVRLDERIEELLAGNFDVAKAASEFMAEQQLERKSHLKDVAEGLLKNESLSGQALDSAYEMAVKANEGHLSNHEQRASHLAVLARATFMKGEKGKAVELQENVIRLMADAKTDKADMAACQVALESYKAGHLPAMSPRAAVITLKTGDAAPKLNCGEWIQGKPVAEFAKDKAYLIEFWATWCVPCVAEIPHLNALHLKFKEKGLVVIGQNVEGKDQTPVKAFVKKMADRMTYPVALDQMSGSGQSSMAKMWLEAAGLNSIPSAFLVGKDGRLVWIGHPNELKETMIEEALADNADRSKTPIADPTSAGQTTEKK